MSQLTNLAFFRARPGQTQALGSALSALVDPTRAETECLNYDLHQSIDDGDGGSTSQASQRPALMRADSSEAAFYELP